MSTVSLLLGSQDAKTEDTKSFITSPENLTRFNRTGMSRKVKLFKMQHGTKGQMATPPPQPEPQPVDLLKRCKQKDSITEASTWTNTWRNFQPNSVSFMSPKKNQWMPALSHQHSSADEVELFGAILKRGFFRRTNGSTFVGHTWRQPSLATPSPNESQW